MKRSLMIIVVVFLGVSIPAFAQEVSKIYCLSGVGYTGTIDDLKAQLLLSAREEVVLELFGESITLLVAREDFVLTKEETLTNALEFVRLKGEPVYSNGQNLGEVCVTIDAYATEEDVAQFQPLTLTKKSCIDEDEEENKSVAIKQETEKKAILVGLKNYDQRMKECPENKEKILLSLVHDRTFSDEGHLPETNIYCAKATGTIYPIEVIGTFKRECLAKPEPDEKAGRDSFFIDFTKYEFGDIPLELLGQNLVIGQTDKGEKYIRGQSTAPVGEIEIKDLSLSGEFELMIKAYWYAEHYFASAFYGTDFTQSVLIVSEDGEDIKVEFVKGGFIIFGTAKRSWPSASWSAGVNEMRVLVKGGQAKLFINNQLFGSMLVKPDTTYSTVIVKGIIDHDGIFGFSVKTL